MKYMGSKSRIAKEILAVILKNRKDGQYYVEPFCGGCNSIQHVDGNRIAGDANRYLIAMWKGLQKNLSRPKSISKELYSSVRNSYNNNTSEYSDFEKGWIGFMASFNGRFFDGGYSGVSSGRDYIKEQINNTEKQISSILGIEFFSGSYLSIPTPEKSIIYCDIPYKNTKQYSISKNFDYDAFYSWCLEKHDDGHDVFISEYSMPEDKFQCIWSKPLTNAMATKNTYKPIEKLFKVKNI